MARQMGKLASCNWEGMVKNNIFFTQNTSSQRRFSFVKYSSTSSYFCSYINIQLMHVKAITVFCKRRSSPSHKWEIPNENREGGWFTLLI